MVLVSPNYPSAFPNQNQLPAPGPKPFPEAVPVYLTNALKTEHPYAITGDKNQGLWLSPEAAEWAISNGHAVNAHQAKPK